MLPVLGPGLSSMSPDNIRTSDNTIIIDRQDNSIRQLPYPDDPPHLRIDEFHNPILALHCDVSIIARE